ncbi:hypothetical protein NKR19_g9348 [Coniochaeta hoffmannii]|uniref:NADH:ubiquinone oxidoreductase 6.6kD subunit n=1 Tax=Coniochaeta hoffmannii TaxID=91930 RepID=A0AA38R377_9PEZI|nr:hypothetical protein NKR19_g9348 [Coniochaeta hoffmannii]
MGGLQHYKMALDPAIIRVGNMNSNRYKYFRWTPRTARITFIWVVAVPAMVGYAAYKTDGLWDFRAKRRGDLLVER